MPRLADWVHHKRANQRVLNFYRRLNQALLEHWSLSHSKSAYADLESALRSGKLSPAQAVSESLMAWGFEETREEGL
ncbi:MAG: hypothetical protein EBS08_03725 [Cytophagia bacterium]|nr:hypothetical protein [Cytophagia bacterium]